MPVLGATDWIPTLIARNTSTTNHTSESLQVICAWPVSGQYGPGARLLYYFLVAACVLARRSEWLRNACLAAALLLPAIAAVHGITLAALHVDGATDMDIYGTFQLCAIGILAAPVTAKHSRTYFEDPSRNLIFVWTGLVLAGLVSLTVEFFRTATTTCDAASAGYAVSSNPNDFQYNVTCGLVCDTNFPISPMRGGSANNIYVIPAPYILTFGTATLLAAACCIPAILSLMSMWNKILQMNWKRTWGRRNEEARTDEGTDAIPMSTTELRQVNNYIKWLLGAVEVPVFGAAVFAILIAGEMNFWSLPVNYQSEPIAAIGQWSPIAGTVFALLGSLYLILAVEKPVDEAKNDHSQSGHECHCDHSRPRETSGASPNSSSAEIQIPEIHEAETMTMVPTITQDTAEHRHHVLPGMEVVDVASRRRVRGWMHKFVDRVGTPAPQLFDESAFKHRKARAFPVVPGEQYRVQGLHEMLERYNQDREEDDLELTPSLRPQLSRSASFIESVVSRGSTEATQRPSLSMNSPPPSTLSPVPPAATPRRLRVNTLPSQAPTPMRRSSSPPLASSSVVRGNRHKRRETLDVSSPSSRSPFRGGPSSPLRDTHSIHTPDPTMSLAGGLPSPAIVVTSSPEAPSQEPPSPSS